jgi:uncharacterized membrane protein YozB (DUF420 family)
MTHQVTTRTSKDTLIQVLASFNVFVPHQALPSLLNPFPNTPTNGIEFITRILAVVIAFSVVTIVVIMLRKKRRRTKMEREGC